MLLKWSENTRLLAKPIAAGQYQYFFTRQSLIQYQLSPEIQNQTSITIKCAWACSSGIQAPVFGCSAARALAIKRSRSTPCSQGSLIWAKVSKVALLTSGRRKCCGKISTTNIEINDDVSLKDHRYVLTKWMQWNKSNKLPHSLSYNAETSLLSE